MAVKKNQVASGVRVKLNDKFETHSLSHEYLKQEKVIFISDGHIYNDPFGDYVFVKGGSLINAGIAHLTEIDLEFPIPEYPMY